MASLTAISRFGKFEHSPKGAEEEVNEQSRSFQRSHLFGRMSRFAATHSAAKPSSGNQGSADTQHEDQGAVGSCLYLSAFQTASPADLASEPYLSTKGASVGSDC